jgi:hypothetical protein
MKAEATVQNRIRYEPRCPNSYANPGIYQETRRMTLEQERYQKQYSAAA